MSTTAALLSAGVVAFAGIAMILAPEVTKPTVPFGVRVPPERTRAPSVTAARHLYTVRAAAVAACWPRAWAASSSRADRDDDRFWKAGLLYVNRGDPALVVAARFGAGWTVNLANPAAWLVIAALIAAPAGLAAILTALGNAPG